MCSLPLSLCRLHNRMMHLRQQHHKSRIWLVESGKISVLHVRHALKKNSVPLNNLLSSHEKRSPLLWLHNNNSRLCPSSLYKVFKNKLYSSEMVWYFIGVPYNKQNITCLFGVSKFLYSCWKIFHSFAELTREICDEYIKLMYLNCRLKRSF